MTLNLTTSHTHKHAHKHTHTNTHTHTHTHTYDTELHTQTHTHVGGDAEDGRDGWQAAGSRWLDLPTSPLQDVSGCLVQCGAACCSVLQCWISAHHHSKTWVVVCLVIPLSLPFLEWVQYVAVGCSARRHSCRINLVICRVMLYITCDI